MANEEGMVTVEVDAFGWERNVEVEVKANGNYSSCAECGKDFIGNGYSGNSIVIHPCRGDAVCEGDCHEHRQKHGPRGASMYFPVKELRALIEGIEASKNTGDIGEKVNQQQ